MRGERKSISAWRSKVPVKGNFSAPLPRTSNQWREEMDRANEGEVRRDRGNTADRADRARKHEILHYRGKRRKAATRA